MIKLIGIRIQFTKLINKSIACLNILAFLFLFSCIPKESDTVKKIKSIKNEDTILKPGEDGYTYVEWDIFNNPYQKNDYLTGQHDLNYYLTELGYINARNINFLVAPTQGQNCEQWIESQPEEIEVINTRVIIGTGGVAIPQADHCLYQELFNGQISCVYLPKNHTQDMDYRTPVSYCEDGYGQYTLNFQILPESNDFNMFSAYNWVENCDDLYDYTTCENNQTHLDAFQIQKDILIASAYDFGIQAFISESTYNYYALKIYQQSELNLKTFTATNFREDFYSFVVGDLKYIFIEYHNRLPSVDAENRMKYFYINALPTEKGMRSWIRDTFVSNSDCSEIEKVRCPEFGSLNGAWGYNYPICDYNGKFTNSYSECRLEFCDNSNEFLTQYGECINPYIEQNTPGNIVNDPKRDIIEGINRFHIDYEIPLMAKDDLEMLANQFMITISTFPAPLVLQEYRKVKVFENKSAIQSFIANKFNTIHRINLNTFEPAKSLKDFPEYKSRLEREIVNGKKSYEIIDIIVGEFYVPDISVIDGSAAVVDVDNDDTGNFECKLTQIEKNACSPSSLNAISGEQSRYCLPNRMWSSWQTCFVTECPANKKISGDNLDCEDITNSSKSPDQSLGIEDKINGGVNFVDAGNSVSNADTVTLIETGSNITITGSVGYGNDSYDYYKISSPHKSGIIDISLSNLSSDINLVLLDYPAGTLKIAESKRTGQSSENVNNISMGQNTTYLIGVIPHTSSSYTSYSLNIKFRVDQGGIPDPSPVDGILSEMNLSSNDFPSLGAAFSLTLDEQNSNLKIIGKLEFNGDDDKDAFKINLPTNSTGLWKVITKFKKIDESSTDLGVQFGFISPDGSWGSNLEVSDSNIHTVDNVFSSGTTSFIYVRSYDHLVTNLVDYELDIEIVSISNLTKEVDRVNGQEVLGGDINNDIGIGQSLSNLLDNGNSPQQVSIQGSTGFGDDIKDVLEFTPQKSGTINISISNLQTNNVLINSGDLYIYFKHGSEFVSNENDRGQEINYSYDVVAFESLKIAVIPFVGAYSSYKLDISYTPDENGGGNGVGYSYVSEDPAGYFVVGNDNLATTNGYKFNYLSNTGLECFNFSTLGLNGKVPRPVEVSANGQTLLALNEIDNKAIYSVFRKDENNLFQFQNYLRINQTSAVMPDRARNTEFDISSDGNVIAISLPKYSESNDSSDLGLVYVFRDDGDGWFLVDKLDRKTDKQLAQIDTNNSASGYGNSISLNQNGSRLAVGMQREGGLNCSTCRLYVYEYDGSNYKLKYNKTPPEQLNYVYTYDFGRSVDFDSSGDTLVVGSPGMGYLGSQIYFDEVKGIQIYETGALFTFDFSSSTSANWNRSQYIEHPYADQYSSGDYFGNFVGIDPSGTYLFAALTLGVVDVNDTIGNVQRNIIYKKDSNGNFVLAQSFDGNTVGNYGKFHFSPNGRRAMIRMNVHKSSTYSDYLFQYELQGSSWREVTQSYNSCVGDLL